MSDTPDRASGPDFPCPNLGSALVQLRRPPSVDAVRFKIQNTAESAAQIAAYVDARMVYDRLDQVCGPRWRAEYEPLPAALIPPPVDGDGVRLACPPLFVRCRLRLFGVTRQDVGEGSDPKAAFSDAVKRAAVQFGVGRVLYAMRLPWLAAGDGDGELRRNSKSRLVLDARSEAWCREQYGRWLEHRGIALYGEPLDHGDERGAPGLEAAATDAPPTAAPSEDREGALHVADPGPGDADDPATHERAIDRWARTGRYREQTVADLARLACGAERSELSVEQLAQLAWQLEVAARGRVSDADLATELTGALEAPDREAALRAFTAARIGQAQQVGLLGRRAA